MGAPSGVRLSGAGGLVAGAGVGDGGGPSRRRRTRRDADAGLAAGSRQDREEPRAGTLLSGQAGLDPAGEVNGWRRAGGSFSGQPAVSVSADYRARPAARIRGYFRAGAGGGRPSRAT